MIIKIDMELSEFEEYMLYRKNASLFIQRERELRNELGGKLESLAGAVLDAMAEEREWAGGAPPLWVIKNQTAAAKMVEMASGVFG